MTAIQSSSDLVVAKPQVRASDLARDIQEGVKLEDFYAVMPRHAYLFAPARDMWPAASVNGRLPPVAVLGTDGSMLFIPPSVWLDRNRPVEQLTWAPGLPMLIEDRLIAEGGWIDRKGVCCFNLYRPPTVAVGDPAQADLWLDHVRLVYPHDAAHIISYFAHRVQRPHEKINHALVLGGAQGIGKDTLLEPVKHAVGPWNVAEVSPQQGLGRFNGFLKSVILRVSEARDLGEVNRFAFYDHMKAYIAAPPDVLRVDEKNVHEHSVPNVTSVIITTNHKTDGIYLPPDDRRHLVAWSDLTKDDFSPTYWNNLWSWYFNGGINHVAVYLAQLDLSTFDPKAPPPKTAAFWDIVNSNRAPEDAELADVLDEMGNPDATTLNQIRRMATGEIVGWLSDAKHRRSIPHRLERCSYMQVHNENAKDGLWKINGKRQAIYAKSSLSLKERFEAAKSVASA